MATSTSNTSGKGDSKPATTTADTTEVPADQAPAPVVNPENPEGVDLAAGVEGAQPAFVEDEQAK